MLGNMPLKDAIYKIKHKVNWVYTLCSLMNNCWVQAISTTPPITFISDRIHISSISYLDFVGGQTHSTFNAMCTLIKSFIPGVARLHYCPFLGLPGCLGDWERLVQICKDRRVPLWPGAQRAKVNIELKWACQWHFLRALVKGCVSTSLLSPELQLNQKEVCADLNLYLSQTLL